MNRSKFSRAFAALLIVVLCGLTAGATVSASKSNLDSTYQSTQTTSGIKTGTPDGADGGFQINVAGNTTLSGGVISSTQKAVDDKANSFQTGTGANGGTLTVTNLTNSASFEASAAGGTIGVGSSVGSTSLGVGNSSGSASSVTQAGITGIAGHTGVRTGDKDTTLAPIFDKEREQADLNAQVAAMSAFTNQTPKAVATYADGRATLLREQDQEEEALKWDEGGIYRIALHTLAGAAVGGLPGAAGAGASAAAAPTLNAWQQDIEQSLQAAGLNPTVSKVIAQGITGAGAAVIGGIAGGGPLGVVTGYTVDANNRQLHPVENQRIRELATKKARELCQGDSDCEVSATRYWTDMLERAAESLVDTAESVKNKTYDQNIVNAAGIPGSDGSLGGSARYFDDLGTAHVLLRPDAGNPIIVNGRVLLGADGQPQTYFGATPAQRANPSTNTLLGQIPGDVIPGREQRDQDRLDTLRTQNGSAQPLYPVEELLLGGAIGNRLVGTATRALTSGEGVAAQSAGETEIVLPGMNRPVRPGSADFPPNQAVVDASNSPQMQLWVKNTDCIDCSEIAPQLLQAAGGKGQILEIRPSTPGNLNVFENGRMESGQSYHQVYTDGRYVYDPRLSSQPIPKGDWEQHIRNINPGGINISIGSKGLR